MLTHLLGMIVLGLVSGLRLLVVLLCVAGVVESRELVAATVLLRLVLRHLCRPHHRVRSEVGDVSAVLPPLHGEGERQDAKVHGGQRAEVASLLGKFSD